MPDPFRLLMLGAMYENGGNTVHRLLDGHPGLWVYPFESQLGTRWVSDHLASMFPVKYRWPVFSLDATPGDDFHAVIDEEVKVRARTPHVSKFRHVAFEMDDLERRAVYVEHVERTGRSRAHNVAAWFRATFTAWRNHHRSGQEQVHVGYSPIVTVDADKILADLPEAHVLHVVRNPWSAYADTLKRPVPLSLAAYMTGWAVTQYHALLFQRRYPGRLHVVRLEDVLADPVGALTPVLEAIGLGPHASLRTPSWNGQPLEEVRPWGTIRRASPAANRATADELGPAVRDEVSAYAAPFLDLLRYHPDGDFRA